MSALAARRAAQAAGITSANPILVETTVETTIVRESSPSLSSLDDDSSSEAGPSKRRKITKKTARYFAPEEPEDDSSTARRTTRQAKRGRRFSPSAPAPDSEEGEDGVDSSDDSDSEAEAERDVDEGRADWTVPSTPRASLQHPSRVAAMSVGGSRFKAVTGVNLQLFSSEELMGCGFPGNGAGVVLSLGKQDSLMLAGIYTLSPLQGSIDLFSTTLSPSSTSVPVFSPSSHPIPVIVPSSNSISAKRTSSYLSKLPLPPTFQLGDSRTVVLVREHDCGLQGLKGGIVPGFSNIWGDDRGSWGLKTVNPVMGSGTNLHPHVTPESWLEPLRALSPAQPNGTGATESDSDDDDDEPIIALIKGPKRSGKSTFARAVLNNLLNRYEKVAWLECDLGQGEFSPGGAVGLWILDQPILGPPFTHPRIPEKAHYLGSFTPQSCPDEYITCIQQLIQHYQYELSHPLLGSHSRSSNGGIGAGNNKKISNVVPMVINTQGWVKGLGEELLHSIELAASPTHVYGFEAPYENDIPTTGAGAGAGAGWTSSPPPPLRYHNPNLNSPHSAQVKTYTLTSAPVSPLLARHTPSDLRTLSLISYFHSHAHSHSHSTRSINWNWDFSRPLLAIPPYQTTLSTSDSGTLKRVIMLGESGDSIHPSDLRLALDGQIVALVQEVDQDPARGALFDPAEAELGKEESTYLGLALIRAIRPLPNLPTLDTSITETGKEEGYQLHIVSPLPLETLQRANTIVRNGAVELPLCGMLDWRSPNPNAPDLAGVRWEEVPYLDVSGVVGVGGERRKFRRNLMRKGQ